MAARLVRVAVARELLLKTIELKNFLPLIFIFLSCMSANSQNSIDKVLSKYNTGDVPYVSVEELNMIQSTEEILVLDAREFEEYEVSHLENAVFLSEVALKEIKNNFPKDTRIVVYCSLGVRSEKAARELIKAGFNNVRNLYGGIFEWKNKGYTVVNSEGKSTQKVHVYSENWSKYLKTGEKIY